MKKQSFTLLEKYLLISPNTNRTRARSPRVFTRAPTGDGDLSPKTTDLPNLNSTMREREEREKREKIMRREKEIQKSHLGSPLSPRTPPIYNGAWPIIYLLGLFKIIILNYLR